MKEMFSTMEHLFVMICGTTMMQEFYAECLDIKMEQLHIILHMDKCHHTSLWMMFGAMATKSVSLIALMLHKMIVDHMREQASFVQV